MRDKAYKIPVVLCGNSPFVTINLERKDLIMLVDSGAWGCLIDRKHISLSDEQLGDAETLTGLGDNTNSGNSVMVFFGIGDKRFCSPFTTLDLGKTFDAFKDTLGEVSGIIGGEFLCNYEAILDYSLSEMRISSQRIDLIMQETLKSITKES